MSERIMAARGARVELPYLDGLRGAAALMVVAFHAFLYTGKSGSSKAAMPYWDHIIGFGYLGVAIFIVLSGYVLMLPLVRTPELEFKGGIPAFVKRRARRILPPYYAAVLFALLLIGMFTVLQQPHGTAWDSKLPVTWPSVISHLLLLHDLSPDWIVTINGPLWSVAVEWQIYFVMALVLAPLWRRIPAPVIVAVLLGLTLIPAVTGFGAFVHPWFVALFAAGMWAAQLTLSSTPPRLVGLCAILLAASLPFVTVGAKVFSLPTLPFVEIISGLATAAALVWVGRRAIAGESNPLVKPFQSRPMMFVGLISYSIYLFHSPVLGLLNLLTLPLHLPTVMQYLMLTFIGIPIALGVSWGMFWLVERHFLNTHQRRAEAELSRSASDVTRGRASR